MFGRKKQPPPPKIEEEAIVERDEPVEAKREDFDGPLPDSTPAPEAEPEEQVETDAPIGHNGHGTNGNGLGDLATVLQGIAGALKETQERLEALETSGSKDKQGQAHLEMVRLLYDTDDKHLPELTKLPLNAVQPYSLGIGLESILTDTDVMSHEKPISQVIRNAHFRLLRSVGGIHLGRGARLAEEQAAAEQEQAQEMEMGEE